MSNHESCIEDDDSFCRHPHPCGTTTPATQALLPVTTEDRLLLTDIGFLNAHALTCEEEGLHKIAAAFRGIAQRIEARHRQAHSLPGGVGMREALKEICGPLGNEPETNHASLAKYWREIAIGYRRTAIDALTPSAVSGGDYAEAFNILVDVQSALVLTADHSQGATVASFVSSSTQYERLNRFLHERQHADPRSPSALSGDAGEGGEHYAVAMERRPKEIGGVKVGPGLYRIHWKSGGSSLAAIGMCRNGAWWVAPTNWVEPAVAFRVDEGPEGRWSWHSIDALERIEPALPSHKGAGE